MKKISNFLVMLLLIGALIVGTVLVRKNQETRKGAAAAETSTSVLPSTISADPDTSFKVTLIVNTGSENDKMMGAEMVVNYDVTKVKYESIEAASGYVLVNDPATIDDGAGKLTIKMVTLGTESAGAVSLAKLNFKAIGGGSATIAVSTAEVMINGQTGTWKVEKHDGSMVTVSGATIGQPSVTPKITSILPAVTATPRPTNILPVITPTLPPAASCNARCQKDTDCGTGMICKPLWWSCEVPVPTGIVSSIQNKEVLTATEVANLVSVCPDVEKVLISSTTAVGAKVAPAPIGMCRNPKCVNDLDCFCGTGPIGTAVPYISATVGGAFLESNYAIGSKAVAKVNLTVNSGKISGAEIAILFDATRLNLDSVDLGSVSAYSVLKKEIDNSKGRLILGMTASKPASELLSSVALNLSFTPKTAGSTSLSLDSTYINQVSGIDGLGKSVTFAVRSGTWGSTNIGSGTIVCQACIAEPSKAKGNANCDSKVDLFDFEMWRNEAFDQGGLKDGMAGAVSSKWKSDFDCDGKVMLIEFEIWRRTVYP